MRIKHKFNSQRVKTNDASFDSKLEHEYFLFLELLRKKGEVIFFLRQTPFHLPNKSKYIVDFTVFWKNGKVTFEDVKGMETKEFKIKKKWVESLYPIEISIVKKGMFGFKQLTG